MVSAFVKTHRTVTTKGDFYCVNYTLISKGGQGLTLVGCPEEKGAAHEGEECVLNS